MPFVLTALGYLVFKNKYSIRPILGCFLQAHSSWLYILLLGIWPVIISGIGCYLAARTSYTILKKRLEIQALLTYCESGLNASRFYRLVLFCITFLILALPATLLTVLGNLNNGLLPYDFYEVHKNWNTIMRFTAETGGLSVLDYAKPLTGLFVFLFFGTGQDAMNSYLASTPTSYRSHFYERNDDNLNHIDDLLAVYPPDIAISRSHNSNIGEEDYNNNNANYHRESGIDNLPY
ncbi:4273_t:CDS:2 [Entrophospora sp. SA101]|nr:4273_t:CDS:2 [Entrophospora sp. SA101]